MAARVQRTEEERKASRRESQHRYRANNLEKVRAASRKWDSANPRRARTAQERLQFPINRIDNPDVFRGYELKKNYGMSLAEYNDLVEKQDGACGICGDIPTKLVVDHDHATDKVRGLLCNHCNLMLGHAKDNVSRLLEAGIYLEAHRGRS